MYINYLQAHHWIIALLPHQDAVKLYVSNMAKLGNNYGRYSVYGYIRFWSTYIMIAYHFQNLKTDSLLQHLPNRINWSLTIIFLQILKPISQSEDIFITKIEIVSKYMFVWLNTPPPPIKIYAQYTFGTVITVIFGYQNIFITLNI